MKNDVDHFAERETTASMTGGGEADAPKELRDALSSLFLDQDNIPKERYQFWETQPVLQFGEESTSEQVRKIYGLCLCVGDH